MAVRKPAVEVDGIRKLARALKKLDDDLAAELKATNKSAAQIVADEAARRVPVRSGQLRGSIRALGQARGASVAMGKAKVPYAGPVEFGGYPQGRPFVKTGRYLLPAAADKTDEVFDHYSDAVADVVWKFD